MKSYENIGKFTIGQKDDYATVCLLDSPHFKENCKMTAIALSKQQALDADMKRIQHHLYCKSKLIRRHILFFIIKEAKKKKKPILDFLQGPLRILWTCFTNYQSWIYFWFNIIE